MKYTNNTNLYIAKSKNTARSFFKDSLSSEEIAVKAVSADDSDNKEEAVDSVKSSRKAKSRKPQDLDILSAESFETQDTLQNVVSTMDTTCYIEEPTSKVIVSEEPIIEAD